jgi:putative membrane protein
MWIVHDGLGWWMVFGGILMVLFWGGIIALIIWGISRLTRRSSTARPTPLEIAKERYARGEITKEQFEEIKKNL